MAYTTIDDPSAHFHMELYTGNGSSGHAITNDANAGDFQPDWVWIKNRGAGGHNMIFDSTRGATKAIYTNLTNAEGTVSGHVTDFDSDGFTLGDNSGVGSSNGNTETYVAWQWKANGGTTTAVSASGSGASQVLACTHQANTTSGFSIVRFTGVEANATVTHGLGAVPEMILFKDLLNSNNWIVYHQGQGNDDGTYLNLTSAEVDNIAFFNDTTPTSTVFTVGTNNKVNRDASNSMIAYCFAPIQGFSKFGTYTGNGNADGPFIYTGFKPAWVMWKEISAGSHGWMIHDSARSTINPVDNYILAESSNAEANYDFADFLSNGFKQRHTSTYANGDGVTYIYMAFAENPFVTSGGVPCTAV